MALTSSFAQSPDFLQLLDLLAKEPAIGDDRFHARNFLLETEIPAERVKRFLDGKPPKIGVSPEQSRDNLNNFHNSYLTKAVRPKNRTLDFSSASPYCPDTFREGCQLEEFRRPRSLCFLRRTDEYLLRVEDLRYITTNASWQPSEARELLTRVAAANRSRTALSPNDRNDCGELFDLWQQGADNRPLCAAFWNDVKGVVSKPKANWPNELRDRLGLVHYDPTPKRQSIPVAAFRYPIKRIPKRNGTGRPLLVRSTILDGTLNLAFYTHKPKSRVGKTLDLLASPRELLREVVHPAVTFEPGDLWAVGNISAPLPKLLGEARGHHARRLIADAPGSEFAELCKAIDGDLI